MNLTNYQKRLIGEILHHSVNLQNQLEDGVTLTWKSTGATLTELELSHLLNCILETTKSLIALVPVPATA